MEANFLTDDMAHEKVQELTAEGREYFDTIVTHLKKFFEEPQHRYMARPTLSFCQRQSATTGEDPASQKGMVLEEFVDRLRSDIRPHVNLDNLATLEQDLGKAPKGEQLKAEATEARFISSATPPTSTEVKPMNLQPVHTTSQAPVLQGYSMPIDEIVFLIKLHALTAVVLDILCDNALCPGFALRTENFRKLANKFISMSLRGRQQALKNPEARISALVRRNE
ncbi:hypothetical protein ANCDUO_01921 [Ancylostoma duodenale]|uniref:Uncharacterized protein n=1 Tax=Ancylostoma duodenale TaxID=51022 RepID=A0A0C2DXQ1_9BILA|nr:hypothetical protein ANCDUO_01921 [Ancylostoma duodenale]